jgi:hypothetical protein
MKKHKLPVKPYLQKYLQAQLVDGVYRCDKRLVRVTTNSYNVLSYFEKHKESPSFIWVEMHQSSLYTLFGLQVDLCNEFRSKLFSVMAFARKNTISARDAARQFLKEYGITDEEYSLESAYRSWERKKDQFLYPTIPVVKPSKRNKPPLRTEGSQLSIFV